MGFLGFGKKKDDLDNLKLPDSFNDPAPQQNSVDTSDNLNLGMGNDVPGNSSSQMNDPFSQNSMNSPQGFNDGNSNPSQTNPSSNFDSSQYMNTQHQPDFNQQSSSAFDSVKPTSSSQQERTIDTGYGKDHQLEVISSKIDVVKSMVENLTQRVHSLEAKIEWEIEQRKKQW